MTAKDLRVLLLHTAFDYVSLRTHRGPVQIETITTGRQSLRICLDEIEEQMIHAIQNRLEDEPRGTK